MRLYKQDILDIQKFASNLDLFSDEKQKFFTEQAVMLLKVTDDNNITSEKI